MSEKARKHWLFCEFRSIYTYLYLYSNCSVLFVRMPGYVAFFCRYLVTHLMGADLNNIVRTQRLTDEHVQFLVYQILRGLKVYCPINLSFYVDFCLD